MSKKPKLKLPKPHPVGVMFKVGEPRPEADMSLVPHTTGESLRVSFRADPVTLADIEQHLRRLEARAPGFVITLTDAVRSLIQEGARSYSTKFRDEPRNEDEHE
jgi:hypothetical protein